jgi:hypothetical protein
VAVGAGIVGAMAFFASSAAAQMLFMSFADMPLNQELWISTAAGTTVLLLFYWLSWPRSTKMRRSRGNKGDILVIQNKVECPPSHASTERLTRLRSRRATHRLRRRCSAS